MHIQRLRFSSTIAPFDQGRERTVLTRMMRFRRFTQDALQARFGIDVTRAGFYSPIVDRVEVRDRSSRIWSSGLQAPEAMPDIDFRPENHKALLAGDVGRFMRDFDFDKETPKNASGGLQFTDGNDQFGWLDARMLVGMLRHHAPARVIEVGSGFSTLIMDSVVKGYLRDRTQITAIEPFPRPFLADLAHVSLLQSKVQDVPLSTFDQLQSGDVLFIDSSHVAKTGSDVNYLFFEVLPRLPVGVLIHVHDIWLPLEYPQDWVLTEARCWNEQYLLRALLSGSRQYQIELAGMYLYHFLRPSLDAAIGASAAATGCGSSFWMRKVAAG